MADEKSSFETALPWLALAAGVGGLAYATTRPGAKKAAPAASAGAGEGSPAKRGKKRRKAKKTPEEKGPPGPYALFVKAQMPLLKAKGMDGPKAMAEIGRLWRVKQGKA